MRTVKKKDSKKRFFNIYKFSSYNNSKFTLLLRKGVYPCEYIDDWGNMEDITIAVSRMQKEFVKILK